MVHLARRRFLQSGLTFASLSLLAGCAGLPMPGLQPPKVPQRVTFLAEELAPHVVVHAVDFVPGPVVVLDGLGADEPAASCYKNFHGFGNRGLADAHRRRRCLAPAVEPPDPREFAREKEKVQRVEVQIPLPQASWVLPEAEHPL